MITQEEATVLLATHWKLVAIHVNFLACAFDSDRFYIISLYLNMEVVLGCRSTERRAAILNFVIPFRSSDRVTRP